ncbi:MAG: GtrA family protein [Mesorhizobium sp.]|nr:GtrA family protein [Mesorhizobium sp. M7A.F.Ca.MR.148.00.0.0]RVD18674.1 GtrA family protein [Mesorhizobium sp. M7A.F.Ca.ET.027.02.1.1]RVD65766.1 GtrA family protein [Mesorhizobium sp. M7A.F.Ca.ET.027.03.2.1]RWD10854.1 MAG: GtrA family protein [Mesorhizobium sp.]RWP14064.1 MAG: GtrA family protein [Mesorhizobium sp.]
MIHSRRVEAKHMRQRIRKLPDFLGVGALGFIVDATVFFGLTLIFSTQYWRARIIASIVAIATTWAINRVATFSAWRVYTAFAEFLRYLVASSVGAGANLAVMSAIAPHDASLRHVPAYCAGAAVGLVVNFLLYNMFVFPGNRKA